jgi:5-methylcytosine-specific restriction protein A
VKTYLLTWNPQKWEWDNLPRLAEQTAEGKKVSYSWSCGVTKRIEIGSRIFLMRLGRSARGIVGAGRATTRPFFDEHWNEEKRRIGKKGLRINCDWDTLLDSKTQNILPLETLRTGRLADFNWTPQASGVEVDSGIARELESVWSACVKGLNLISARLDQELAAVEGEKRWALIRHRKREQKLRIAKLADFKNKHGSLFCEVSGCGFNFEKVYGDLGKDFAHVHHLKPLGSRNTSSKTSLAELAVVCANCHAMIHRDGKCRDLDSIIP